MKQHKLSYIKFYQNTVKTLHFYIVYGCFCAINKGRVVTDSMAQHIYHLALYRNSLPTPGI